jgi:hypothetical protein
MAMHYCNDTSHLPAKSLVIAKAEGTAKAQGNGLMAYYLAMQ